MVIVELKRLVFKVVIIHKINMIAWVNEDNINREIALL